MEKTTFKRSKIRQSESRPKIHESKTKCMTNCTDTEDILIEQEQNGKKDRIQILPTSYTPQKQYKRRNLCQD